MKKMVSVLLLVALNFLGGQESISKLESELAGAEGTKKVKILMELTGKYSETDIKKAILFGEKALTLLKGEENKQLEAEVLTGLYWAYRDAGEYEKALQACRRRKQLAEEAKDSAAKAEALDNSGSVYRKLGDYRQALANHTEALKIWRALDNKERIASTFHSMGSVYKKKGSYDRALDYYLQSLRLEEQLGNKTARAYALNSIGTTYHKLKKNDLAFENYSKALAILKELEDKGGMADVLNNLGLLFQEKKEFQKAINYFESAVEIENGRTSRENLSIAYNNIGEAYKGLGKNDLALDYYLRSIKIAEEIGDKYGIVDTSTNIAAVYREMGRFAEALDSAHRALGKAKEIAAKAEISECFAELSNIYAAQGDYRKAYEYQILYKAQDDEIFNESSNIKIAKVQAEYAADKKEIELLKIKAKQHRIRVVFFLIASFLLSVAAIIFFLLYYNRKKAGEIIRQSEEKYRRLVEWANDGIAILQDGEFKFINPAFSKMLGCGSEEIVGLPIEFYAAPGEKGRLKTNYQQRMAGKDVEGKYETVLQHKNGSYIHLEVNAGLVAYENRPAVLVIARDISERKLLEEERLKRSKFEAVGSLAGGIAHDFNNLLAVILGNIELARVMRDPPESQLEILTKAERATLKARDLAKRFLTFSEGGEPFKRTTTLRDVVEEALEVIQGDFNVEYRLEIPQDLWQINCDDEQIYQVFTALIANAVEAMAWQGEVIIKAENINNPPKDIPLKRGKYVKISVLDKGEGIPAENLPKIFDPYFSTRKRTAQKGLGFGLAIVYSIIKRHHGHVQVDSEVGKGTGVTIFLPV